MSDDSVVVNSFAAKLAAAQARRGQTPQQTTVTPAPPTSGHKHEDLVPDVDLSLTLSDDELELDRVIKNFSIVNAYIMWINKSTPKKISAHEYKVSCPNPQHPDKNPSSDLNDEKNLWVCHSCAMGGDLWDLAAWHFGYSVPGYKQNAQEFRELRSKIAGDLGYSIITTGGRTHVQQIAPGTTGSPDPTGVHEVASDSPGSTTGDAEASGQSVPSSPVDSGAAHQEPEPPASVGVTGAAIDAEQNAQAYEESRKTVARIDWRSIVPEDTFLHSWLEATTVDDCPEEFHFWTGLMAIGFAIGRNRTLQDAPPVYGNLFTCLVGPSGAGKSKAKRHLRTVLHDVLPWRPETKVGVKPISSPGSGEYITAAFDEVDELNVHVPVVGLVEFEELSGFTAVSLRTGSTVKSVTLELYDTPPVLTSGAGSGKNRNERYAERPFGSMISTTQTEALRTLLDKRDDASGVLNRWVFASGKLKPPRAVGGVAVNLSAPGSLLNVIYMRSRSELELGWNDDALELFTQFFHNTLYPDKVASEMTGVFMLNRLDLLMKKLILLLSVNMHCDSVPKAAVEQAIALYPYLVATYSITSTQIDRTEKSDREDLVVEFIREFEEKNKTLPTQGNIWQSKRKSFRGDNEAFVKLLDNLVKIGILEKHSPVGKQKGDRYRVATS